jgi:hypothetical protein
MCQVLQVSGDILIGRAVSTRKRGVLALPMSILVFRVEAVRAEARDG